LQKKKKIINNFDWNNANEIDPCNNSKCLVKWEDGTYHIDEQYFGEWSDEGMENIVQWIDLPEDFIDEAINFYIKYLEKKEKK